MGKVGLTKKLVGTFTTQRSGVLFLAKRMEGEIGGDTKPIFAPIRKLVIALKKFIHRVVKS